MTWTDLFVCCIGLLFAGAFIFAMSWVFDPKVRKEAGVRLHGDDGPDDVYAKVEAFDDPTAHPDQWSEKIILPAVGRRPETIILIRNSETESGDGGSREGDWVVSQVMLICDARDWDRLTRLYYTKGRDR